MSVVYICKAAICRKPLLLAAKEAWVLLYNGVAKFDFNDISLARYDILATQA